ncbi:uncharacterized protein LOC129613342 [Condylostylus longicornis]|uniref:uncharacterized protein LOC129613342 n=1 Tax=Condylostylus longicornis TaxID=2530218 RepID=UPI00244E2E50|nr:uncharacterized protein LOC129613342 [Condylostylus longicornis]
MKIKFNKIAFLLTILLIKSKNISAQGSSNNVNPNTNPNNNLANSNLNQPPLSPNQPSDLCIECICNVMSGCRSSTGCFANRCGPFNISDTFWSTGGAPKLSDNDSDAVAFERCANNKGCASQAVKQALSLYSTDCNGDNQITCSDYLAIHMLNAKNCRNFFSNKGFTRYLETLNNCEQSRQTNDNQINEELNINRTTISEVSRPLVTNIPQSCINCLYNATIEGNNINSVNCARKICESNNTRQINTELGTCISNRRCTPITIEGYLIAKGRDCNNDQRIDCSDFIAIYAAGFENCSDYFTHPRHFIQGQNFDTCISSSRTSGINDTSVKLTNVNSLGNSPTNINELQNPTSTIFNNVSLQCLKCIYDNGKRQSNETMFEGCKSKFCGPLNISEQNWISAGEPSGDTSPYPAFTSCAYTRDCAIKVIEKDIINLNRDCNNDRKVDCLDYLAIISSNLDTCEDFFKDETNKKSIDFVNECINPKKESFATRCTFASKKFLLVFAFGWIFESFNKMKILYLFLEILFILSLILIRGFESISDKQLKYPPVTQQCIGCMCEAINGCNENTLKCELDVCGPFRMTKWYWADAENKMAPMDDLTEFEKCANDVFCSFNIVQKYMEKYRTDCNEDGEINCLDYIAIHKMGKLACHSFFVNEADNPLKTKLENSRQL